MDATLLPRDFFGLRSAHWHHRGANYSALCADLGQMNHFSEHRQTAEAAGLVPSRTKPEVVEAIQEDRDEVSLRLQGTYADGRTYETEFHVFRDGEQLLASKVVYWLPVQRVQANCEHESGQLKCGATVSPPSQ